MLLMTAIGSDISMKLSINSVDDNWYTSIIGSLCYIILIGVHSTMHLVCPNYYICIMEAIQIKGTTCSLTNLDHRQWQVGSYKCRT